MRRREETHPPPPPEPVEEPRPLWLPGAEDRAPEAPAGQTLPPQDHAPEAALAPRPPAAAPHLRRRGAHEAHPPPRPERQSGWTTKRLTLGAAMGAAATIAGALLFVMRFGDLGGETSPLLAIGFGLFAIGMIVFSACLIALLGIAIGTIAARRGWPVAVLALLAPLAIAWGLWAVAALVYAVPAVLSLVLIAALLVALK